MTLRRLAVMYHNQFNHAAQYLFVLLLFSNTTIQAGGLDAPPNRSFTFNFQPINSWDGPNSKSDIFAACGVGNLPIGQGAKAEDGKGMCADNQGGPGSYKERYVHEGYIPGEVLFLQERDKDSGIWHQVLIDNNHGFKMDIYASMSMGSAGLGQGKSISGGKNDGHVWPIDPKNPGITGTGTGDARRVNYRMLIEDDNFTMDMLKDKWDRKPKISQTITGQGMHMELLIDMSNSSFSDMNTPAIVTHTTDIADTQKVEFDSRTSSGSVITGGRYRMTGSEDDNKSYQYIDAPRDYGMNLDWVSYWHGSEISKYWQPGEPYGYPDGDSGDSGAGEDTKW